MHKRHILLLIKTLLLLVHSYTFAQQATGVVYYEDIESLGAPGANLKPFNAALYFSPEVALYVTRIDSLENGKKNISKTYTDANGAVKGIKSSSTDKGLFNITYRKESKLISNARFKSNFTYQEALPEISWKISNQSKEIGGIKAIKATTKFRGRNYTAWFSPEIAVPLGPWKLQGLPGLILEAHDDHKEIHFIFKKIVYPYKGKILFPEVKGNLPDLTALKREQDLNYENNLKYQRAIAEQYAGSISTEGKTTEYRKRYFEIFE
ncbi:GLPGLI family protein [Rufibacter immobilis]|uniref:GLPGLI family protein n=1 Tax=Rufibacter immobilis TaxID=1348778 RepID=A0A3M9MWL1_9BACT|nr:GLPGLI family protein [Rufibacter immobilis]RNI29535.1 GLPGLI family protein [Rufibacter immobilis]